MSQTYPQYSNTTFPDSVQSLISYLDIQPSDLPLYTTYIQYIYNGDYASAQTTLSQIPNFQSKTLTAQNLNQLTDTIMALQTLYNSSEFQSQVASLQQQWQSIINQFTYQGVWSASTSYLKNNIVKYQSNVVGQDPNPYLYIATQNVPINGNNPYVESTTVTSNPKWIQLTVEGVRGESGADTSFGFNWVSTEQYQVNTIVIYDNAWWVCTASNINTPPSTTSSVWDLILEVSISGVPVQSTQPDASSQNTGELWFQLLPQIGG